jgi:hypothetical protein
MSDWVVGSKVPFETIRRWIETVNSEFGLSERNEESYAFLMMIREGSFFLLEDWGYCVVALSRDPWGYLVASVVSFYIRPENRDLKHVLGIERAIDDFSRKVGADFIEQGSHLSDKLFKLLEYCGYKPAVMRKDLRDGK